MTPEKDAGEHQVAEQGILKKKIVGGYSGGRSSAPAQPASVFA